MEKKMELGITDMRRKELKLFIIEFNKASQLDRSFSKTNLSIESKRLFRKKLLETCIKLMEMVDDSTITNRIIRKSIKDLKNVDGNISFGQAQQVINVCLKQYCFITGCLDAVKELDFPLDSTTMKGYKIRNKRLIDVAEEDYVKYQREFEKEFNGIRIFKDLNYTENRIHEFLK